LLTPFNAGSADAVVEEIRRQKTQGADFIKVGMVPPEVFFVALEEGRKQGIALLGHLQEGTDALDATAAGFRSVEHLGPGSTVWICCSDDEAELRADSYRREVIKAPPFKIPFLETLVMKKLGKMLINPRPLPSRAMWIVCNAPSTASTPTRAMPWPSVSARTAVGMCPPWCGCARRNMPKTLSMSRMRCWPICPPGR
jgi:hypothetical protein